MTGPIPSLKNSKTEWRTWALAERRALELSALSVALREALAPALATAQHALLYVATEEELDVLGLAALATETRCYLPRCAPKRRLAIHAYPCALVLSRFGIWEPEATLPEVSAEILDLVLVPALVLDRRGYRLGYGGGYYDRFLPRLRPDCRTIGVAPFLVDELPTDPWDVPVGILGGDSGTGDMFSGGVYQMGT